jgi:aminopeptidase N
MRDFLTQLHYPIVSVDIQGDSYTLTQKSSSDNGTLWRIPLFLWDVGAQQEIQGFLLPDGTTCPQASFSASSLLLFNHKSTTYARFRYSEAIWQQIMSIDLGTAIDQHTLLGVLLDAIDEENDL